VVWEAQGPRNPQKKKILVAGGAAGRVI